MLPAIIRQNAPSRFMVCRYDKQGRYEDRVAFFQTEREATDYAIFVKGNTGRRAVVFELHARKRV